MSTKLDNLLQKMAQLETSQHSPTSSTMKQHTVIPLSNSCHMKLEVPRLDGSNPLWWIFKITQFYEYYATPDLECLIIASFYMEGPALAWYQWMLCNGQISSCPGLLQALEARFAPSQYEDPTRTLFKLIQHRMVNEYLSKFETLANCIVGLLSPFFAQLFYFKVSPKNTLRGSSIPTPNINPSSGFCSSLGGKVCELSPVASLKVHHHCSDKTTFFTVSTTSACTYLVTSTAENLPSTLQKIVTGRASNSPG